MLANLRDRSDPVGYNVVSIAFNIGAPVEERASTTAAVSIFAEADNSKYPTGCFRPVGLALDTQDRLFMSSDSIGDIYVLTRTGTSTTTGSVGTSASATPSATSTQQGADLRIGVQRLGLWTFMFVMFVVYIL